MTMTFVEVTVIDRHDFETGLHVHGEVRHGHRILTGESSTAANASAGPCCCNIRDLHRCRPHIYFE
jgi:hypothetical protein